MLDADKQCGLQALVDQLSEGPLDDASADALQRLLAADDEAVDYLARRRMLEVQLEMEFGGYSPAESHSPAESESDPTTTSPVLGFLGDLFVSAGEAISRPTPLSYFIAFVVVASGIGLLAMVSLPIDGLTSLSNREIPSPPASLVAHLGRTRDLRWADKKQRHAENGRLFSGDVLEIERGRAEIIFTNGTELIVVGAARLRLDSDMAVHLTRGKVSVLVPPRAHGFTVDSPVVKVIDRGTDFEVDVNPDNTANVRVFTGKVDVALTTGGVDARQTRRLIAGQAARFDARQGKVEVLSSRSDRSIRRFASLVAETIDIKNPSFELPRIASRNGTAQPQHWQTTKINGTPLNGTYFPPVGTYSSPLPHGQQAGYVRPGNTLVQELEHAIVADRLYELTVYVGARGNSRAPVWYAIDLLAGDELLSSFECGADNMLGPDRWIKTGLRFRSRAGKSYLGRLLTIRLRGHADSPSQINFDEVRLTVRPIEPKDDQRDVGSSDH